MQTETGISVVIPVRNRPDVIHRAIDSILAQTRPADEIIVVDDGSTDDTPDSVERRQAEIPMLRVVRLEKSGGAPRARNAGVAAARYSLIALLDSDDAWLPEKLALQEKLLQDHPESPAVFCSVSYERIDGKSETVHPPAIVTLQDLQRRNIGGSSMALIRKDAFEKVGGFRPDMPSCQDWEMWLRLAELGTMYCVPVPLVSYHFDGGGRITRNIDNVFRGHMIVFDSIYARIEDKRTRRKVMAEHQKRLSEIFSRHMFMPVKAFQHVARAFLLDPSPKRALDFPRLVGRLATFPVGQQDGGK